ncbi:MAG: sigma 54-interacting transcriptional regulator [Proteobacteria bacterium]|nr:sigma 54-interacting transcriptional regulator [Pseudomonadota bacterium]
MGVDPITLVPSPPPPRRVAAAPPAGLLQCFPLGEPPRLRFFALPAGKTVCVGRASECAIHLDDERISRQHLRLMPVPGGHAFEDQQSRNGVFVEGLRQRDGLLQGGELLRLGGTLLRYYAAGRAPVAGDYLLPPAGLRGGPALEALRQLVARAAAGDLPVLLCGETGTGKELAARELHGAGPRAAGPLVTVNCAALPEGMAESELFGHLAGAFSGATTRTPGLFRQAAGGTILLDEIGELALPLQAKLLRVLQDRVVRAVGASVGETVDARVVCATNRDLAAAVRAGAFRADLLARVAGLVLVLPPLRERREDIPLLVTHFCAEHDERRRPVSVEALEYLWGRGWPLNVRELEHAVRRALLLAGDAAELELEHFRGLSELEALAETKGEAPGGAAAEPRRTVVGGAPQGQQAEAEALRQVLRLSAGDPLQAARALGISRSQLYRRAKALGIAPGSFRG